MAETYDLSNPNKPKITKDPNATLDYSWDWSDWLLEIGDTISSFDIIPESPLAEVSSAVAAGIVTAFISGGVVGTTKMVTCRIVTAGGRTDDRTIYLQIKER